MAFQQQISTNSIGFPKPQQNGFNQLQQQQPVAPPNNTTMFDELDQDMGLQSNDAVSKVKFSPSGTPTYQQQMVAASCWDGTIFIWSIETERGMNNKQQQQVKAKSTPMFRQQVNTPILGFCWRHDLPQIILACADNNIMLWDLNQNAITTIGQHQAPVKDVASFDHSGQAVVVSGGWDAQVKFWCWTQNNGQQMLQQVQDIYVAMPVHYMSCVYPLLVTAHQDRICHVWNLQECFSKNNFNPTDVTDTTLKFSTSAIECFGNGKGFLAGSIEGRCSVINMNFAAQDRGKGNDFCFKCHRIEDKDPNNNPSVKNETNVFQVNGFAFNKQYNTFCSYGADGTHVTWNKDKKAKYRTSPNLGQPICAADMSDDGTLMCCATGYDYSRGAQGLNDRQYQNKLYLRTPNIYEEIHKMK